MEEKDCNDVAGYFFLFLIFLLSYFCFWKREDCKVVKEMRAPVAAVEKIVRYRFKNKALLQEALTHKSYNNSASYERLEFLGDAVLSLAIAKFLFTNCPNQDQDLLTRLRSFNVDNVNLARVADRHDLYRYVRRSDPQMDEQVKKFAQAVQEEGDEKPCSDLGSPPKVLADIVESIAAAVFIDCNYDLKRMWGYFSHLLEPIVTPEVYLMGSGYSEAKYKAAVNAAKEKVQNLLKAVSTAAGNVENGDGTAKEKLNEFCNKKRWLNPIYRTEKEFGPGHERRFICSVKIYTKEGIYVTVGDTKSSVKVQKTRWLHI